MQGGDTKKGLVSYPGMGLGVNWSIASAVTMMPSLVGHLVYGAILGTSYAWLRERSGGYATAAVS